MALAADPGALVAGVAAYLVSDGPADLATVGAWLPSVEPSRARMPAAYAHVLAIPNARAALTGAGGARERTYRLAVDVWRAMPEQAVGEAQAAAAVLAQAVQDFLLTDPTLDGLVSTSGGTCECRLMDDAYADLLEGRGIVVWRITLDCSVYSVLS